MINLSDQAERINSDLRSVESPAPVALAAMLTGLHEQLQDSYPEATIRVSERIPRGSVPDITRTVFEKLLNHAIEQSETETPTVKIEVTVERRIVVMTTDDRKKLTDGERAFL